MSGNCGPSAVAVLMLSTGSAPRDPVLAKRQRTDLGVRAFFAPHNGSAVYSTLMLAARITFAQVRTVVYVDTAE